MAQNYRTAKPTFVEDIMYQPPWELAREVIMSENKKVKDELDKATALTSTLNFDTLDFDKPKADEKRNYYTSKIEELTTKINKDPMNYNKYSLDISNLQKEMLTDFTSGDIGAMTGDYGSYQKWLKDNEKIRDKSPARFNAAGETFLNEVKESRKGGLKRSWNGEQVMEDIDFRDGFLKHLKQAKPNIQAYADAGTKGGFIFKEKGTNETLGVDQVQKLMSDYLTTTPNIKEFATQSNRIGLPVDVEGLLEYSKNFAYSKTTGVEKSLTRDPMSMIGAREESAKRLAGYKHGLAKDLAQFKAGLKGDNQEIYNGEVHTSTAQGLMGEVMLRNFRQDYPGTNVNSQNTVTYGLPSLISQGVVNEKQAKALETRLETFKNPEAFGNKQIVFVPSKSIRVNGSNGQKNSFQKGQSYIMTLQQAQRAGLINKKKPIAQDVPGKPFYFDDKYNGVQFNFRDIKGGTITGNLMPTGTHTAIKEGLQIFNKSTE